MEYLKQFNLQTNIILKDLCSMHVGGPCKYFIEPQNIKDFVKILKYVNKINIKYFILGNGTNTIFTDKGFNGLIICTKKLNKIQIDNLTVCSDCGVNLFVLNNKLIKNSLSGLEFSYGIPGTVGGAVCMNAGAYGGEIGQYIIKLLIFDGKNVKMVYKKDLDFSYRSSTVQTQNWIVLKVWLKFTKSDKQKIQNLCKQYLKKRIETQPLNEYNSGSIFKITKNIIPGKIIDNLGLKSVTIRGAQISTKHANFIINKENAKCDDILALILLIQNEVFKYTGVKLNKEILIIGEM